MEDVKRRSVFVLGKHMVAHAGKVAALSDAITASIFARRMNDLVPNFRMVILPDFARRYKLDRENPE